MSLYDPVINQLRIKAGAMRVDYNFLVQQKVSYKKSEDYKSIVDAFEYYNGYHDIIKVDPATGKYINSGRKEIGAYGELISATNAIDKRIEDNQFAVAVDKKKNYLFGRGFTLSSQSGEAYLKKVNEFFDADLIALINKTATVSILAGEAYWYPYYDEEGALRFKLMDPRTCLVFYGDEDKEHPISFLRFYRTSFFDGKVDKDVNHMEYYTSSGVTAWEDGVLLHEEKPYNTNGNEIVDVWEGRLPLIIWKQNYSGRVLFREVKGAQDALNEMKSQIVNNGLEDERTTLLWVENYSGDADAISSIDGKSLRTKLNDRGIIFTETVDGVGGGVHAIRLDYEPEKRLAVVNMLKQTIVENMRSFDAKVFRDAGNPNMLNIQSAYSDMEEDAMEMERLFQRALDQLLFFVNRYLKIDGDVDFVFNKTMLINESEKIQNIVNSREILPNEFLIAHHPWVTDAKAVIQMKKEEEQEALNRLQGIQTGGNPYLKPEKAAEDDES